MNEELRFALLQELRKRQHGQSSENEWVNAIDGALTLKVPLDNVLTLFDELSSEGSLELRRSGGDSSDSSDAIEGRITASGRGRLRAWLQDQQGATSWPVLTSETIAKYPYDIFVSHASEDAGYLDTIVDGLQSASLETWYDRDLLESGSEAMRLMNEGIGKSRSFLVVASPFYFDKPFADSELATILHLATFDPSRKIVVLLYMMSHEDLRSRHPMLSARINVNSSTLTKNNIVQGIVHLMLTGAELPAGRTPAIETGPVEITNLEPSVHLPGVHESPSDALPLVDGPRERPQLKIGWYSPGFVDGVFSIQWWLESIGSVAALDIAVFMPGLLIYRIPALDVGEADVQRLQFEERYAYYEIMKPPISSVIEYADANGRNYRQYASVSAFPKWNDRDPEYVTTQLGFPYEVSKRIVTPNDDDDRFHRTRVIGWHEL